MEPKKIDKVIEIFRNHLYEEVPVNSLSTGKIAGTAEAGDDPPVRKKRKKYISGGRGSRKFWLDYLKNK